MNKNFLAFGLFIGLILFTIIVFFDYTSKKSEEKEELERIEKERIESERQKRYNDSINDAYVKNRIRIKDSLENNLRIRNQYLQDSISNSILEKNKIDSSNIINLTKYFNNKFNSLEISTNNYLESEGSPYKISVSKDGIITVFNNGKEILKRHCMAVHFVSSPTVVEIKSPKYYTLFTSIKGNDILKRYEVQQFDPIDLGVDSKFFPIKGNNSFSYMFEIYNKRLVYEQSKLYRIKNGIEIEENLL